jgi:hypothetical protein
MPTAILRLSRVVYFTDMQHSDAREIPIGVVAEANLDHVLAIGAAMRPSLTADDLDVLGPAARKILANPMDSFWPEIEEIFNSAEAGQALNEFARRHTSSLSVLAPVTLDAPRRWLLETDTSLLINIVKDRLGTVLEDEYYRFLFPPRGPVAAPLVRSTAV